MTIHPIYSPPQEVDSYAYGDADGKSAIRQSDGARVPLDATASEGVRRFIAWVSQGNVPKAFAPPIPVVDELSDTEQLAVLLVSKALVALNDLPPKIRDKIGSLDPKAVQLL